MELIDQHTKTIMEGCKERARDAGLRFEDETLEYIVTNRDLIELSPKVMIPTLYDYWVHDVEVLKEKGKYELYPGNPYETVINTRPAISFYNDNNPDWLNVMIFYHVLGHIDFFQNNLYFRHTWDYDFTGQALVGQAGHRPACAPNRGAGWTTSSSSPAASTTWSAITDSCPRSFQRPDSGISGKWTTISTSSCRTSPKPISVNYVKEMERYNTMPAGRSGNGGTRFLLEDRPASSGIWQCSKSIRKRKAEKPHDLMEFIMENSKMLRREENQWMKTVMQIVRKTSLYFQPQIRTKIMNEGWASYWHETLFMRDDRIEGHEVDFARVNAAVTAMPRVGLNPYALGMRLFYFIEELAEQGKISREYQHMADAGRRKGYDAKTGKGE